MKNHFLFLEDGTPVSSVKNQAKKLHKSKSAKSLSDAQNQISRNLVNKPFNKASADAKELSPFIISSSKHGFAHNSVDTLFLPIKISAEEVGLTKDYIGGNYFYFYVPVTSHAIYLSASSKVKLNLDGNYDINNIQTRDIQKLYGHTKSGWRITIGDLNVAVEVRHEEGKGIVGETWFVSDGELIESIDSDTVRFQELVICNDSTLTLSGKEYSDYEACIALNQSDESDSEIIMTVAGLDLELSSTFTITNEDGEFITADDINSEFNSDQKCEVIEWLQGRYNSKFENWECVGAPWFEVVYDNGDQASEIFSELPEGFQDRILLITSSLAYK